MRAQRLPSDKILKLASLQHRLTDLKAEGRRVVFTNGCFDLLHPGHVRYLQRARSFGDVLVVGLNSDASVRRLKGSERPILSVADRCEVVAALECVDFVTIFDQDTPLELIQQLVPDVLVKGGDWPLDQIVGREVVQRAGGKVIAVAFEQGYSTTDIIARIRGVSPASRAGD